MAHAKAPRLLTLAAALCALLALPAAASAAGTAKHKRVAHCANADVTPDAGNLAAVRAAVLCLHNRERAARGLPPLREKRSCARPPTTHSRATWCAGRFFAHDAPGGADMATGSSAPATRTAASGRSARTSPGAPATLATAARDPPRVDGLPRPPGQHPAAPVPRDRHRHRARRARRRPGDGATYTADFGVRRYGPAPSDGPGGTSDRGGGGGSSIRRRRGRHHSPARAPLRPRPHGRPRARGRAAVRRHRRRRAARRAGRPLAVQRRRDRPPAHRATTRTPTPPRCSRAWRADGVVVARRRSPRCGRSSRTTPAPTAAAAPATACSRACASRTTGRAGSARTSAPIPGPKEDRLRLTRATRANLSPIFSLYDGDALVAGRRRTSTAAVRRGHRRGRHDATGSGASATRRDRRRRGRARAPPSC